MCSLSIPYFNLSISVHPCEQNKAGCEHICKRKGDNAICKCREGFKLAGDGKLCVKVHPCDQESNGGCSQQCIKTRKEEEMEEEEEESGFQCKCNEGFELEEDGKTCQMIHPCDRKANGGCNQICKKNGKDAVCLCRNGFVMSADNETCVPVHPCDKPTKGGCDQMCNKKGDGRLCSCKDGFELEEDGRTCEKSE